MYVVGWGLWCGVYWCKWMKTIKWQHKTLNEYKSKFNRSNWSSLWFWIAAASFHSLNDYFLLPIISIFVNKNEKTYRYKLIGVIHHGDKQIEKNNNINNRICAKHEHAPETCEYLNAFQFKGVEVHQSEYGPK